MLSNIISHNQKGFLKNFEICENTCLLCDLIQALEEEEQEGLLLLFDYEKAFDSPEWSFIDWTLTFFNFGESVKNWVKVFYTDITSAIAYNGHLSAFFPVSRGVRQGDPLSPYLFILCLELLVDGIKLTLRLKVSK